MKYYAFPAKNALARFCIKGLKAIVMCGLATFAMAEAEDYPINWEVKFNLPRQDAEGWSIFLPSADTRIIYVSTSGNDDTAKVYLRSDAEIGRDPFNPGGAIKPYRTIAAAMGQARNGYPDYVLLKRGDTWVNESTIQIKAGRSLTERSMLGYYGSATARPLIKTGTAAALKIGEQRHAAIVGVKFTAHKRVPTSADFVGFKNVGTGSGFNAFVGAGGTASGIIIEDCYFEWYSGNSVQSAPAETDVKPYITDFIVRRNIITNSYSTTGHSQGLYAKNASILLEENVFDHNGWYRPDDGGAKGSGEATMYNHNTYFAVVDSIIFRRNMFLRASSIGNKFTANPKPTGIDRVMTQRVLLDNNLYIEGELGVSIGGNKDFGTGPRFADIHVVNNVMMHIGRTRPTGRNLGWGLEVIDWKGGAVKGNVFTSWGDPVKVPNVYALSVAGHTINVDVTDNIMYSITGSAGRPTVMLRDGVIQKGTNFSGNDIQAASNVLLLSYDLDGTSTSSGNRFYSPSGSSSLMLSGKLVELAGYRSAAEDNSSVFSRVNYVEPSRTIESYLAEMGQSASIDALVAKATQQSKFRWQREYTAAAINDYIRGGFCVSGHRCTSTSITPPAPMPPQLRVIGTSATIQ